MPDLEQVLRTTQNNRQKTASKLDEVDRLVRSTQEKEKRVQSELKKLTESYESRKQSLEKEIAAHDVQLKDLEGKRTHLNGEVEYADRAMEQARLAIEHNQKQQKI